MADGETVTIGVVASFTGPGAVYGTNIRKGVELAVYEINENGGILGHPVRVIYENDATDGKQTISATQKLITRDNAVAIVGGQWNFLAEAVAPVVIAHKMTLISPAAVMDGLLSETQSSAYVFTTFPGGIGSVEAVRSFVKKEHINNVVILSANNTWGKAHVRAYTDAVEESGAEVLDVFFLGHLDGNDLRTEFSKIIALQPEGILTVINDSDNITFTKRYREFRLKMSVLMHENFSDPLYTERLNIQDAEGFYFFEYPDPSGDFAKRFKKYHGEEPQIAADTAYDAIYTIKRAAEAAGEISREKIAAGMRSISFEGASGPIQYKKANYPVDKKALLKRIENGTITTF